MYREEPISSQGAYQRKSQTPLVKLLQRDKTVKSVVGVESTSKESDRGKRRTFNQTLAHGLSHRKSVWQASKPKKGTKRGCNAKEEQYFKILTLLVLD